MTILLTTLAITAVFWKLFAARKDVISHLSIATAYPALLLTAAAVLLGPWNVLRGHNNPVSFISWTNTTACDTICSGSETILA